MRQHGEQEQELDGERDLLVVAGGAHVQIDERHGEICRIAGRRSRRLFPLPGQGAQRERAPRAGPRSQGPRVSSS